MSGWTPGESLPPDSDRRGRAGRTRARSHPAPATGEQLADGEWHHLHPATPLLRGGFFLVVVLGYVLNSAREQLLNLFIPHSGDHGSGGNEGDPVAYVVAHQLEWIAALGILAVLVILVGVFYVSWRMNTFRVTGETVETRSGVLFRTNRRARLDRIQGINVQRPLFARLFGAAKLEINQAGHDANVPLAYLRSSQADEVRREILRRASGVRETEAGSGQPAAPGGTGLIEQRLHEFMASPLGEDTERETGAGATWSPGAPGASPNGYGVPTEQESPSVVRMHLGRLIGSAILTRFTLVLVIIIAVVVVSIATTGQYFLLVIFFPTILGSFSYYSRRVVKSLRYSIASTRDGIRIGWGLLSTSNETLPPGRIHSVKLSQPLLWRPFGWWEVKINRASHASGRGADNQANTTILPVGSADDVAKVLGLILPELVGLTAVDLEAQSALDRGETAADLAASQPRRAVEEGRRTLSLIEAGMTSTGAEGGFTTSPRRGQWLRWFSWHRNGFRTAPGSILLRKGAILRELIVVPLPRVQSVGLRQGPLLRRLRLADVELHTVQGPITADIGALDERDAMAFFQSVAADAVVAARADRTHRWLERGEAGDAPLWQPPAVDTRLDR